MRSLAVLAVSLLAGACASAPRGKLAAGGYRHALLPVGVRTTRPDNVEFVSPEWRVESYGRRKGGDDLSLEQRRTGAALFLRVELLSGAMADLTLEALARDQATTLGGRAARIVSAGATRVGDRDAYQATVDLPGRGRLLLVLVETGYRIYPPKGATARGRAVVVLGLRAEPKAFEASQADFGRFVDALELGPGRPAGYR